MALSPAERGDIEWLDLGPPDRGERGQRGGPPRQRRVALLAGAAVLVAAGIVLGTRHSHHRPAARPTPPHSAPATVRAAPSTPVVTATSLPASGKPAVTLVGHPLLGATEPWELFVRGPDAVSRVQLSAGRVTVTPVPDLNSGGSVGFLVTQHQAIVRPSDFVDGFGVPDGAPARPLPGPLQAGGAVFPGPHDGEFWHQIESSTASIVLELLDADGRDLHRTITLPETLTGPVEPDGAGYVIADGVGGSYDARPGRLRRITTGRVMAVGPTAWLAEECDDVGECSEVEVDRTSWQRQTIGPTTASSPDLPGVISPDGSRAVLTRTAPGHARALDVLDVATGAERQVTTVPDSSFGDQIVAWSPDSRWLFVVGSGGALLTYDADTLARVNLGVRLPPAVQVAIRTAPAS